MMTISQTIVDFVHKSVQIGDLDSVDIINTQNQLLNLLALNELTEMEPSKEVEYFNRLDLLDQLLDYAVKADLIDDNNSERDVLGSKIMNLITPLPSEVNDIFWSLYESDKKEATDYFYKLSTQNNYIKSRSIAQNIAFEHDTEFGTL